MATPTFRWLRFQTLKLAVSVVVLLSAALLWENLENPSTVSAAGSVYYVDATAGLDKRDGKSPETAWQSIGKVSGAALQPGDKVLFKRGEIWRGGLFAPGASGTADNPIVFGSYGPTNLPLPRISGGRLATDWQGPGANGEYYWRAVSFGQNGQIVVLEDGRRLTGNNTEAKLPAPQKGSLASGEWAWDSVTTSVYYKPTSGLPSGHELEIVTNDRFAFSSNQKSYVELEDLDLYGGYSYSALIYGDSHHVTIRNSRMHGSDRHGVRITVADDNKLIGNEIYDANFYGVYIENGADRNLVSGNTVHDIGVLRTDDGDSVGIYVGGASTVTRPLSNVVTHNTVRKVGKDTYSGKNGNVSRGSLSSIGIQIESASNTQITNNRIYDIARTGISALTSYADSLNLAINGNLLYQIGSATVIDQYSSGIMLMNLKGKLNGTSVLNNTIADSDFHSNSGREAALKLRVVGPSGGNSGQLNGLSVRNNLISGNSANYTLVVDVDNEAQVSNLILDNNLYDPASGGVFWNQGGVSASFAADKIIGLTQAYYSAAKQKDQHSVAASPLFVDAAATNYRLGQPSPAVDAGADVGLTVDMDGNAIPRGMRPDIGAYESDWSREPAAPAIYGVSNGAVYSTVVTATYSAGSATLSKNGGTMLPYLSGSEIREEGTYLLRVEAASGLATEVTFSIVFGPIVVKGVADGHAYNYTVKPVFPEGTGTLSKNGGPSEPFVSGASVTQEGAYVLKVSVSDNRSRSVAFTIDRTPPVIEGVVSGAVYDQPVMPQFNEGTAILYRIESDNGGDRMRSRYMPQSVYYSEDDPSGLVERISISKVMVPLSAIDREIVVQASFLSGTVVSEPGRYKLTVTDAVYNQSVVRFAIAASAVTLQSDAVVAAGENIELTIGVHGVSELAGLDVKLDYDPNVLVYVDAAGLRNGVVVAMADKGNDDGHLHLLLAALGDAGMLEGDTAIVKVTFRVSEQAPAGSTNVSVSAATGADMQGREYALALASRTISVGTTVDKGELNELIATAASVLASATEGTEVGQYWPGSLNQQHALLAAAIADAEAVSGSLTATAGQVQAATTALNEAIAAFTSWKITATAGDLNGDGRISIGDLALIAHHYAKTSANTSSTEWTLIRGYDLNRDGKIDLFELAFVAGRIIRG
ncbi:right-handed parallel beta-helix repeat-containing protein [Paenibacillus alba]|uniref:right-handed parallel beta-helix repeat-containing protein n=1 Tax=Paenibacillus alba TaxID=1197127 RepID=UPI0015665BDB|nr:right-handed parallel beta-helix repeat-containing protein [Paenibacillus alba]NQX69721.1 right-handed parallel beta-helix repeat-containing protein [Paenibacillus alba]